MTSNNAAVPKMKRWLIYADERPQKTMVIPARTLGEAIDACKKLLGPTERPCAISERK